VEVDLLLTGIGELLRMGETPGPQAGRAQGDLGLVTGGALAVREGRVVAAGPEDEVRRGVTSARAVRDAGGGVVLPGWVDAHTHLLFAGTREDEFAARNAGRSYAEIAARGGGIHASVRRFRETTDEALLAAARRHLDQALALGTTTMEVKSGYGLSTPEELRALRLIRDLGATHPVEIVPTFLGAHEIPRGARREDYVRAVVEEMIPAVAAEGLAEFCDVFCEEGVFTPAESSRILEAARAAGLGIKIHADEFGDSGGSRLAARLSAASADHLHGTPLDAVRDLAAAGVVGVLLPGTSFFLDLPVRARARDMVAHGLPLAVASDFNPGSCMSQSMPLMVSLACIQLRLSPAEALVAATANGAAALGRGGSRGRLRPGSGADFQVLDLPRHSLVPYHFGISHVRAVFRGGRQVWGEPLPDPAGPRLR
jgi:imidazolonepropionase